MSITLDRPNFNYAQKAALTLLKENHVIEPPVDPVMIARNRGLSVFFVELPPDMQSVSGFYDFEENAIFVNKDEYPLRQTFTIAHELGHKILHEDWVKTKDYRVLLRDQGGKSSDPREREANAFAAHLLVPRFMLSKYWNVMSVEALSELFAVSVPVIKNRIAFEYGA